jgi:hypothetical protein
MGCVHEQADVTRCVVDPDTNPASRKVAHASCGMRCGRESSVPRPATIFLQKQPWFCAAN